MKLIMPTYCKDFKCIADKCRDNCCIGWEIDIDPPTAEYYKTLSGETGERLRSSIAWQDGASFILKGERCPFLSKSNLCNIITSLGENRLCQICRDHPRYFQWYARRKEGGIGLCCEEAARLILTDKNKFTTYEADCDDEGNSDYSRELYNMLFFARNEIISTLENEALSLRDRIFSILIYAEKIQLMADNYDFSTLPITLTRAPECKNTDVTAFLESFTALEPIDEGWTEYLKKLISFARQLQGNLTLRHCEADNYLKNLAVYFIWRYFLAGVYDEEILSKVRLTAVSLAMIKLMYLEAELSDNTPDEEKYILLAKNYSKEIEYSRENLNMLYDMTYENPAFSAESLISIL